MQEQEGDLELQYKFRSMVFSDFATFSNLINKYYEIEPPKGNDSEVLKMLKHIHFNPKEWKNRASKCSSGYTRTLVAFGYHYSVHLLCWKPNQKTVIHDHNQSWCYCKVLEGSLQETTYTPNEKKKLEVVKTRALTANTVFSYSPDIIHQVSNQDSATIAYSLHVYSPPLKQCYGYSKSGEKELYQCAHHLSKITNQ